MFLTTFICLGGGDITLKMLDSYMIFDTSYSSYICTLCNKAFKKKGQAQNHLQSIHFPDSFSYACSYCTAVFNTRNKLYIHKHSLHKTLI